MKKKTIAEHMRDVLIETDSGDGKGKYSVMYGDVYNLDECAMRCKHTNLMELHPLDRHQRILNALERSKLFRKFLVRITGIRGLSLVRAFETEMKEEREQ